MKQTVLVTGATGFIGIEAVSALLQAGYNVIAASRYPERIQWKAVRRAQLPSLDSADDAEFRSLINGVDHIVHLAGIAHTQLHSHEAASLHHRANVLLTSRLSRVATGSISGKFLFLSSIRAQCGRSSAIILSETHPEHPTDEYGRSKLAAEHQVKTMLFKGNFTILRPVLAYGDGVKGNMDALVRLARLRLPLPFASLEARRSLLSRSSLCSAIVHCLRQSSTDGRTFIVSDKEALTIPEIISAIRAAFGREPSLFHCPPNLLQIGALAAGQRAKWEAFSSSLVADSGRLEATGWTAVDDSTKEIVRTFRTRK